MSTETKTPLLPGEPELLTLVAPQYPADANASPIPWTVALVNTITAGFWKDYNGVLTYVDMCRLEVTCAAGASSRVVLLRPNGPALSWDAGGWSVVGAVVEWECLIGDNANSFIYSNTDSYALALTFESLPADITSVDSVKLVVSVASGSESSLNALTLIIMAPDPLTWTDYLLSESNVSNAAEYNQWSLYDPGALGVNRTEAVNDGNNATGVLVLDAADQGKAQVFRFGKMTASSPLISAVQLRVYGIVTDALPTYHAIVNALWMVDGNVAQSDSGLGFTETVSNGTFTLTNPLGGAWTSTEVNKLRAGIRATDLRLCQMNVLDLELIITYTSSGSIILKSMNGMTQSQLT